MLTNYTYTQPNPLIGWLIGLTYRYFTVYLKCWTKWMLLYG